MARLVSLVATLALVLVACGSSDASKQPRLKSEISSATANLPYSVSFLEKYSTDKYVVFRVEAGASVNIAYGGKREEGRCPTAPRLPVKHRSGPKPFAAAGSEPLICLEHDGWRPKSPEAAAVARLRMVNLVSNALCEEAYDGYEGFACFD